VIESLVWLVVQGGGDASNIMSHLNPEPSHRGTQVTANTIAEKTSWADLMAPIRARMRILYSHDQSGNGNC
jgi:hypothetical protein